MKKLTLIAACVMFYSLAASATSVTAKLLDGQGNVSRTAFLHFELSNCGRNFPVVTSGSKTIVQPSFDLKPNLATGLVSATVIGNDVISCGGVTEVNSLPVTYWLVTVMKDQDTQEGPSQCYQLVDAGSWDPSTAVPCEVVPPPAPGFYVTSFSAGGLSPLFSTSVATPNSTPALSFSALNAPANTYFGNCTGSSAPAAFCPNSDISGVISSVSNSDGTLTISPNTGAVVASLNLGHANNWTANQTFPPASIAISELNATGTPSSSNFLRGDGSWNVMSGVTGSGTSGLFPIWIGPGSIGNSVLSNVTGPPAGINYSLGGGLSLQWDASGLYFDSGVLGGGNIVIANTDNPGATNNAGGIELLGANTGSEACAGGASLQGGHTNSDGNGATISAQGGCANGFGATAADVVLQASSTSASNTGGSVDLYPGTGNFGNGSINFGIHNGAAPVVVWHNGSTNNNTFTEQLSSLPSSWTFKWPASATDLAGELTMISGTKTYTWQGTYSTHPKCSATDETAIAAVQITYTSNTSFTLNTSGSSDVVSYVCLGGS